jgi:F0F1-type ATP synthase assembly protein I
MNKYEQWYESLPEHTKRYLNNQPLWHDIDLAKAFAAGIVVGLIIGVLALWH